MQITSLGVQLTSAPDAPVYTWQQTTRFFILGILYTSIYALIPIGIMLVHNYNNYADGIDWELVWEMALGAVGPVALSYWREHRALLKIPPFFDLPPEWQPNLNKQKLVQDMTQKVSLDPGSVGVPKSKTIETHLETSLEDKKPDEGQ